LDIQLLETFTDLMETQSFNQTAERLRITQSTVSHRIRTLEALLGQRLFDRSRAGTHPTLAGDRFLEHARALTMEWREAVRHVSMAQTHHRVIRLGMHHDIASSLIGAATQQLRSEFSQTAFCLGMDFCAKIAADLLEDNLDFGLLFTPQDSPDLDVTPLGELAYKMVSNAAVHLDQVSPEHYVFPDVSQVFSKTHRQFLPQFTDAPLSCRPSASIAALLQTIPATSYLPLGAIPPHDARTALHVVDDAPTLSQPIYAATHIRNRHADIQTQMMDIFSKLLDRA